MPATWIEAQTSGTPPVGRFQHCMEYVQDLNIIVITGGRNDELFMNEILTDICILSIDNLDRISKLYKIKNRG